MQQAVLALISCDRCLTETRAGEQHCPECGAPAGTPSLGEPSWLSSTIGRGSVPAPPLIRAVAAAVSLLAWLVLVGGAITAALLLGGSTTSVVVIGLLAAVLSAGIVGGPWLGRGRTIGNLVTRTRTVGVISGTPLGVRGLARAFGSYRERPTSDDLARHSDAQGALGRLLGVVAVSLAAGRDPLRLALQPLGSLGPVAVPAPAAPRAHARSLTGALASVTLEFDGGAIFPLSGVAVVGRNPPPVEGAAIIAVPDLSRLLSKTHARLEWTGTAVVVTDLGSTNGSALQAADGTLTDLEPYVPTPVPLGVAIALADRSVTVHYREGGPA
jgi:hypothetical protein